MSFHVIICTIIRIRKVKKILLLNEKYSFNLPNIKKNQIEL